MTASHLIGVRCRTTAATGGSIVVRAPFANGLILTRRMRRIALQIARILPILPKPDHQHAAIFSSRSRR
jgi:hypothetical protein